MKKPIVGVIKSRITAEIWYWKMIVMFAKLNTLLRISPPDGETIEQLLKFLEELKAKLEVD